MKIFKNAHAAILAAAVADYTPESVSGKKIKHSKESLSINLQPTNDIAAQLGKSKRKIKN